LPERTILLIEDNPVDIDLTRQALRQFRAEHLLNVCTDGQEALEFMQQHQTLHDPRLPLLVLLDLKLPKIDGFEVLRWARANRVWRYVPIAALTTSRFHPDIQKAYDLGVNSYLVKPVDFERFTHLINRLRLYWLHENYVSYRIRGD
jgi:CheY-like chemotaxis protein